MGDARTYEYVCALRAVTWATDGMTRGLFPVRSRRFFAQVSDAESIK